MFTHFGVVTVTMQARTCRPARVRSTCDGEDVTVPREEIKWMLAAIDKVNTRLGGIRERSTVNKRLCVRLRLDGGVPHGGDDAHQVGAHVATSA